MLKLNFKFLLLFLLNLNFTFSIQTDVKNNFREKLVVQWKSEFTNDSNDQRVKRDLSINSVDGFNSQSLVVIASEIDDDERVNKPLVCLIKCVANANEIFLISDNTLLDDEIIDHDPIKMYNRIKRSDGAKLLNLEDPEDQLTAEEHIRQYNKRSVNQKPPLQTVQKVAKNSFIIVLDEKSVYPPQVYIHNRPLILNLDEGETFQIKCSVSSIETVSLKWLSPNNETLTELNGLKYGKIEHNFNGIDVSQSGKYICSGQNIYGTSHQVLQINVKPSRLSAQIMPTNNYLAETHKPYTLHCRIPHEFVRNTTITWVYNNQSALHNRDVSITNSALTIKNLNRNSNGVYSCTARMNKIIKTDYIDLKVEFPPSLIGNPRITQNLFIQYDTNYTLSCEVSNAVPEPRVIWDIILHRNYRSSSRNLTYSQNPDIIFSGFKPTDTGTYTCYGENSLAKTPIRTFHIFGKASDKPTIQNTKEFPNKMKQIVVRKEDTVKFLTCKCKNCMPLKSIKWFYNGAEITKIDSKLLQYEESYVGNDKIGVLPLTKTNIKKSEEGEYQCYIENELGSDVFTFDVKVVDFDTEGLDENANATQIKCQLEQDKIYPIVIYKENNETFLGYNTTRKSFANGTISGYGQAYKCTTYQLVYSKNPGFKLGSKPLDSFKLFTIIPNITNQALLKKVDKYTRPDYKICKFNDTENIATPNMVKPCKTQNEPIIVMSTKESEYPELNQDVELYRDIFIISKTNEFLYMCDIFPYDEKMTKKHSYLCSFTNELGFGEKKFLLYRRESPVVSDTVKDHVKILPGTKEIISCEGFGNPQPKGFWKSPDGKRFQQNPKIPNKLEFSIVDEAIAGNYTCHLENIYGRQPKQTYVEIINVPKVVYPKNYREITANPCDLKQLVCPIEKAKNFTWTRTLENADSKEFQMSFNGNYTCIGENEAGVSNFTYIVKDSEGPLSIIIYMTSPETKIFEHGSNKIESITTEVGKQLTAQCVVQGASIQTISIRWLKNNVEYSSEETIDIDELSSDDMGQYTCITDNVQIQPSSFQINLLAPPRFSNNLGSKQILSPPYQSSISLECKAFGSPTPIFYWYYNGILLQNEHEDTLQLKNVTSYSTGEYRCLVTNLLGSIDREYVIESESPLTKPNLPTQIELTEPETLRLPCSIEYSPSLTKLYWMFNQRPILAPNFQSIMAERRPNEEVYFSERNDLYASEQEAATNNIYGIISKSSDGSQILFELIIQQTSFDRDSGPYTCYIQNSVDAIENSVMVNILAKPQSNDHFEEDVTVPEYTTQSFDCLVEGNPGIQFTWELNDQPIDSFIDSTIQLQNFGKRLIFLNITQSHRGKLKCAGINSLGKLTKSFNLNVEGPPKIINPQNGQIDQLEFENVFVDHYNPTTLSCPHIGYPPPNIRWIQIINGQQDVLDDNTDTITLVPHPNVNVVLCTLENSLGFIKKQFNLQRLSSLHFTGVHRNEPIKIVLGSYIQLNCTMVGTPHPEITWTKDGVTISGYDQPIYYVQNSIENDSGNYKCVGRNDMEEISRDFYVEIVAAEWEPWSEWSKCSVSCGVGSVFRRRRCLLNGQDARGMCTGDEVEVVQCVQQECRPRNQLSFEPPSAIIQTTVRPSSGDNQVPSNWGPWSECDLNCHDTINRRYSSRKRYCQDNNCNGRNQEVQQCNVPNCPINGGWGAWIESPCSVTCGEGVGLRRRYCNSPPPKHNGRNCIGERVEAFTCKKTCS